MLWSLFLIFSRVALFSWGGGPASLALMQRETTAVGWVSPAEFADAVAIGNALPGPIAPQVSAYIGYKMAGILSAVQRHQDRLRELKARVLVGEFAGAAGTLASACAAASLAATFV